MRGVAVIVSLVVCASAGLARETLAEFSWAQMAAAGQPSAWRVVAADDATPFARLVVENPTGETLVATVLTLQRPSLTEPSFALSGRVRCEGVEGKGYLELWSHYADGGRYYSRTLAGRGPLAALEGTSGWRRFVVPFRAKDGTPAPERLVLHVVLPGRGRVVLGPVRLEQFAAGEDPLSSAGAWWGERMGGLVGGGLGALLGLLGAVLGFLGGRGRARGFVLVTLRAVPVVGAALLVAGVVAVVAGQGFAVYYPFLLAGLLSVVLPLGLYRVMRRRYEALELRRMEAQDLA